ncbi:MAG: carboxypeptidase regulatory-like domain-containing protein [Pyrinomonadaceae bacterium]
MKQFKFFIFSAFIILSFIGGAFAQTNGSLTGQVVDDLGQVVVGAAVIAVDSTGKEKSATSNGTGNFTINGLAPGKYTVRVTSPNFSLYENTDVTITGGESSELVVALTIQGVEENVDISNENQVNTDSENNLSATVLKAQDLESLPDDPDELEAALQALAGASAGPNGGQIYIDGFTGGQLPPKESIREIRINQNPFSAEFDRLGFGRIEILTKPGTDKFRGQAFFNFNDESLNSRNPFALNRAPSQTKFYGGSVSGPIKKGKASYFLDFSNRQVDNGSLVNAQILDSAFNIIPFREEYSIPTRRLSFAPRLDYQINDKNTLVARYEFTKYSADLQNVGDTSLLSRASSSENTDHEFRLTETMIINPKTVNETRFEYSRSRNTRTGDNSIPTINVASAFIGGGAQVGFNFTNEDNIEFQNYTTTSFGAKSQHAVKFGIRVRSNWLNDRSESNYGGTFTFSGAPAVIDAANPACQVTPVPDNCIVAPAASPLEQYRQKLLGNTDPRFNPTQFTITAGNPLADVSQIDAGLFITDDWRVKPSLTLSGGLRYEYQTNVSDNFNFAPRLAFAYSPGAGGARQPKTVFRGGIGIFYDRISDNLTLNQNRFDGQQQFSYIVDRNSAANVTLLSQSVFTLDGVTNVPTADQLSLLSPLSNTVRRLSSELQSPYTIQSVFSVERQLPARITMSVSFIGARTLHQLRTRNVNAPFCPTAMTCPVPTILNPNVLNALRPDPTQGNIFEYESSGVSNQRQVVVNFRSFYSSKLSFFGNYRYGIAKSDADGTGSFPAYTYDLSGEYSDSSFDIRHFFVIGSSIGAPWGIRLSPFIIATSSRPFNIYTGVDSNGDSQFTERPTFGQLADRCSALGLTNSFCDVSGVSDFDQTIPRNYGRGPSSFTVNLRLNKNFGFGKSPQAPVRAGNTPEGNAPPGIGGGRGGNRGGGGGRGGRGGGGNFGGGGDSRKPYNLNFGVSVNNLFNTVNLGTPVGNLNSSRFGQSTSLGGGFGGFRGRNGGGDAGNRRVELQLRFSF